MPLTISGSVTSPAQFAETLKRRSRRMVSQQLRRQGESAIVIGQQLAAQRLGPTRVGRRRRDHGVSFHNGFQVFYTGLDEFTQGRMIVSVRNRSKHARVLEHGSVGHTIRPRSKRILAWPPKPYAVDGPPYTFAREVNHPGTRAYHVLEDTARKAIIQGMAGRTLGHLRINIRAGRIR